MGTEDSEVEIWSLRQFLAYLVLAVGAVLGVLSAWLLLDLLVLQRLPPMWLWEAVMVALAGAFGPIGPLILHQPARPWFGAAVAACVGCAALAGFASWRRLDTLFTVAVLGVAGFWIVSGLAWAHP